MNSLKKFPVVLLSLCYLHSSFADRLIDTLPDSVRGYNFDINGNGCLLIPGSKKTTYSYQNYVRSMTTKLSFIEDATSPISCTSDYIYAIGDAGNSDSYLYKCNIHKDAECVKMDWYQYIPVFMSFNDDGEGFIVSIPHDSNTGVNLVRYSHSDAHNFGYQTWEFEDLIDRIRMDADGTLYIRLRDIGMAKKCTNDGEKCISTTVGYNEFGQDKKFYYVKDNILYRNNGTKFATSIDSIQNWSLDESGNGYVLTNDKNPFGANLYGGHIYYYENGVYTHKSHNFEDAGIDVSYTGNAVYVVTKGNELKKCDKYAQNCVTLDKYSDEPISLVFNQNGNGYVIVNSFVDKKGKLYRYSDKNPITQGKIVWHFQDSLHSPSFTAWGKPVVLTPNAIYVRLYDSSGERVYWKKCNLKGDVVCSTTKETPPPSPNDFYYIDGKNFNQLYRRESAPQIAGTAILPWGKGSLNKLKLLSSPSIKSR